MLNEQEFFRKHFVVRKGVVTAVDNSTESHTTGAGGHSYRGPDGRERIAEVKISTQVLKKSRVWVKFDGESGAGFHRDFQDEEFLCTGGQRVSMIFHKATGEPVLIHNNSSNTPYLFCDDMNLFAATLLDDGHPLPAWGLDLVNGQGGITLSDPAQGTKLVSNTIHIDDLHFHYGSLGLGDRLGYWMKRGACVFFGVGFFGMLVDEGFLRLTKSKTLSEGMSILALLLILGAIPVANIISRYALRDTRYARFVRTGAKDRTQDWQSFEDKVSAIQKHAAGLIHA